MSKVILITGANSFLFRELFQNFLERRPDDIIIITSKKKIKLDLKHYKNCFFQFLDVTNEKSIKKTLKKIKKKFKKLDGLINFAYSGMSGDVSKIKKKDFYDAADFNLIAPFNLVKNVAKIFNQKRNNEISIINIASIYGIVIPDFKIYKKNKNYINPIHYGATKAGLIHMTKYLAKIYADLNIRINSISPGAFPNTKTLKNNSFFKMRLIEKTCLKRLGKPKDLLGIFNFLLSSESNYITGSNFVVDGGFTL
jgi:NAD(P)-dependent dehydrogenase (short-subunit alcohol dehydrogenase family)